MHTSGQAVMVNPSTGRQIKLPSFTREGERDPVGTIFYLSTAGPSEVNVGEGFFRPNRRIREDETMGDAFETKKTRRKNPFRWLCSWVSCEMKPLTMFKTGLIIGTIGLGVSFVGAVIDSSVAVEVGGAVGLVFISAAMIVSSVVRKGTW